MIVADTNLVTYLLLSGEYTSLATRVYARDAHWIAPPLWRSEFRNVLIQYVRTERLTVASAKMIFSDAVALLQEQESTAEHILDLAAERHLTAYDAEFVALAETLEVPLVTADRRVLASCPDLALSLGEFASTV